VFSTSIFSQIFSETISSLLLFVINNTFAPLATNFRAILLPRFPAPNIEIFFEQKKRIYHALKNSNSEAVIKFKEVLEKIING